MKILLVEDEPKVAAFIRKGLEELNHEVVHAYDGVFGKKLAFEQEFDVIILDVILPQLNGMEVCREIRKHNRQVPILMLTALGTTDDKVTGLDSGADDYLVKPFQFRELIARLNALYRRKDSTLNETVLRIADLEANLDTKMVKRGEVMIRLTAREFSLLELFLKNKGKVLSRVDIAETLWDQQFDSGSNVIDVYVNYLRNKIDKEFPDKLIHTVIGMGYVLKQTEQ
ncbi:MAG: response regulator transcription factor [Bacteroidetes bacterium]|nr:response regulator transcription factor [Bacteroidota bacterium]